MNELLKEYDFNNDMQYFEMIVESFINGQIKQAKEQFKAMPKANKLAFLKSATIGGWNHQLSSQQIESLFDLI